MQFLDRTGVGTLWSMCKTKFALAGHTHNYAGSGSPGGSANSAIGVVDYNSPDDIIQIGISGPGISGDEIAYIAGYANNPENVGARIKDVSKDALQSWLGLGILAYESNVDWSMISDIPAATTTQSGIMSASDKSKLNGIASGANKYTLPIASADTLGGIKASSPYIGGYNFPICVDEDNKAYTRISGLDRGERGGGITQVSVSDDDDTNFSTKYTRDKITVYRNIEGEASLRFPFKSGTFALLSDIPNVSNLCKFNFVNSISDCVNGRINFLFKNSNDYVDLSFLINLEEGTILLIYCQHTGFQITYKPSYWYYNGTKVAAYDTMYVDKAKLVLAFFYNTYTYVSTFSY